MSTSFPPAAYWMTIVAWHPVVWNNGTTRSAAAWVPPESSAGGALPRMVLAVVSTSRFCRLATT